jgi:D-3-phosphoglycerate dehydrogenase
MFKIWFERTLPAEFIPLLAEDSFAVGAANETPKNPLAALGEAQAIIAGSGIYYNDEVMTQAPHLRVISRTGIGLDNVDVAAATARGIAVCNAPDAPTIATAEHAVALMFAVAKQLKGFDRTLAGQERPNFFEQSRNLELYGACLGLVGLGRIGSHVAKSAHALGMTVIAYDPFVTAEKAVALGVTMKPTLEAVLGEADVVSLHLPLTPETQRLINADRLAQMKPGAVFINVARGGLVDEEALYQALESGQLLGAGLDVFAVEPPPPNHPLVGRQDVIVTPHIASSTIVGKRRLWTAGVMNALQVLRGERPAHLVNPEVWPVRG